MRLLIFPPTFVWEFLKLNPVKSIVLALGIVFYSYAGELKSIRHEITFFHQLELRGKWVGIYGDDFDTWVADSKPRLINGDTYVYYEYNPANAFLYLGMWLAVIWLVVGSFANDGWELSDVLMHSMSIFVRCDIEDNLYVYTIFGRLIAKYTTQGKTDSFFELRSIPGILGLPKYETKISKRDRLLRKIGI